MTRRLLISAGELSGEQHAASLITALRERDPTIEIDAFGGELMSEAGARLVFPLSRHAIMGFKAVFGAIPLFARILETFATTLDERRPDAVVLVDYPGLHFKFAQLAKRRGVKVFYYCCPQLWAWAPWRAARFRKRVDHAFTIFEFEERYFRDLGVAADYVGHPSADRMKDERSSEGDARDVAIARELAHEEPGDFVIALLPGSRPQEVRSILPWMLRIARELRVAMPRLRFVVPQLRDDTRAICTALLATEGHGLDVTIVERVVPVLRAARFALVASGTATFEVGFFGVPMIVLYKITAMQRFLGSILLTVPWISQINLIAGRELVPEFVATDEPVAPVVELALARIRDGEVRESTLLALRDELRSAFEPGAAGRAANAILRALST